VIQSVTFHRHEEGSSPDLDGETGNKTTVATMIANQKVNQGAWWLRQDGIEGSQYPGELGIDLSPFSDTEKTMKLLECIQARMVQ